MFNLLNSVQGLLSDNLVGKIATVIGSNSTVTKAALGKILPSILQGISRKGATTEGASSLLSMFKNHDLGSSTLNNLTSSLSGGGATDSLLSKGSKLNDALFGDSVKDMIGTSGLDSGSASKLINLATPIALGALGKEVANKNIDAAGLSSMLKSQSMKVVDSTTTRSTTSEKVTSQPVKKSGGSMMRWLIPLFFLLAAGWFFTQYLGDKKAAKGADKTEMTDKGTKAATHTHSDGTVHQGATHTHSDGTVHQGATHTHSDGTVHNGATHSGDMKGDMKDDMKGKAMESGADMAAKMGIKVDAAGNLVDTDGKILYNKGEFSFKDGEYFDADGNKLNLLQKIGKAMGDAGKAVGGAVAGAAGKTADAFKDTFGGMFKKKMGGEAVAAYGLSDIVFDSESHKITSFSKNEVMGLAEALKATPDAKIKVQVSSADGGDKKVTKMRAQVVHDMLVTLGVADKQISAEGIGEGDGKVSIVIE